MIGDRTLSYLYAELNPSRVLHTEASKGLLDDEGSNRKDRIENFKRKNVVIPRCDTGGKEHGLIRWEAVRNPDCNVKSPE